MQENNQYDTAQWMECIKKQCMENNSWNKVLRIKSGNIIHIIKCIEHAGIELSLS